MIWLHIICKSSSVYIISSSSISVDFALYFSLFSSDLSYTDATFYLLYTDTSFCCSLTAVTEKIPHRGNKKGLICLISSNLDSPKVLGFFSSLSFPSHLQPPDLPVPRPNPLVHLQYRIGQLYMISKHSCEQSGGGEGVEVVRNEPDIHPQHGAGQLTEKRIYLNRWSAALMMHTL